MDTKLWTRQELLDCLSISDWTLKRWIEAGDITPIYIGSCKERKTGMRFTQSELERFLKERARAHTPSARRAAAA